MSEVDHLQDTIIVELKALIRHLSRYEEITWARYFEKTIVLIDLGNVKAIENILGVRGGMGSFSDLVICKVNGHHIEENEEDFANSELVVLSNLVFKSANKLKHLLSN